MYINIDVYFNDHRGGKKSYKVLSVLFLFRHLVFDVDLFIDDFSLE